MTSISIYDGVDRLTHAVGQASLTYNTTTSYDQTFGYSASHNLLQKNRTHIVTDASGVPATQPATTFSSTYGYCGAARPHLPTTIGTMALQYDASGNPTLRQTPGLSEVLVWDDDNRLVQATATGIDQFNTHDAAGLRVLRRSSQGETIFASQYFDLDNSTQGIKHVFAGSLKVASELTPYTAPSGAPVTWSRPAPPTQAGTAYYFHLDHLGSTGVLTNSTGQVQESLEYFVDGEAWIDRGIPDPVNSYLFSGKPYDSDTGFYDFGQRFYDPRTSLWLGNDPAFMSNARAAIGRPLVLASSAFAGQNPVARTDPDGRDFVWKHDDNYQFVKEEYGPNAGSPGVPVVEGAAGGARMQSESVAEYDATIEHTDGFAHNVLAPAIKQTAHLVPFLVAVEASGPLAPILLGGASPGEGGGLMPAACGAVFAKGRASTAARGTAGLYTSDGLATVEAHLGRLGALEQPNNAAMLARLRAGETSVQDLNFYAHELHEANLMEGGDYSYEAARAAHLETLKAQGISYAPGYESQLYHPDVIRKFSEWFNPAAWPQGGD